MTDPQTLREKIEAEVERLRADAKNARNIGMPSHSNAYEKAADRRRALLDEPAQDEPRADQLLSKLVEAASSITASLDPFDSDANVLRGVVDEAHAYLSGEAEGG